VRVWPCTLLVAGLIDALFPPRCVLCSSFLAQGERGFCALCRVAFLPLPPRLCSRCGQEACREEDGACHACRRHPPPHRRSLAFAAYGGTLEEAIHRLKFQSEPRLARPLAGLLLDDPPAQLAPAEHDLLLPVPLHPRRLRQRGYNQAALLGGELSRAWSLPLELGGLVRCRDTVPQSGLGEQERRSNLLGAFAVRPDRVAGRRVLLFDDVITTGSTVAECARTLREGGARSVTALALARALPDRMLP